MAQRKPDPDKVVSKDKRINPKTRRTYAFEANRRKAKAGDK